MEKSKQMPEVIKNDWRIKFYILLTSIFGFIALLFMFLPFFGLVNKLTNVQENIHGFKAIFGGGAYFASFYGILSFVFIVLSSVSSLLFYIFIKNPRNNGQRKFALLTLGLSFNGLALIFSFLSKLSFIDSNVINLSNFSVNYGSGLIFQAMLILAASFYQWFFLINVKEYINKK